MEITTIIVDNFLEKPDVVRQSALGLDFSAIGPYPGVRSDRADEDYERYVTEKLEKLLNLKIKEFKQDSFRFQLCLEDAESWVHMDETDWAAILYLTPNAPYESGTGLYVDTGNDFKLVTGIGNIYNRLVIYPGKAFHQSILPGFGKSKETGRLTQVFFFNTEK